MGVVVQKYGGSSVGSPEKIRFVASKIAAAKARGDDLVVIVSAMGDSTDELIELSEKVSPKAHEYRREMDMLLTTGERVSMALVSMALRDLGVDAISFTGSQAGILTDETHSDARILEIKPIRVKEELAKGKVVIVAGFQGVSPVTKEITTLGRGGSDTTAAAMAVALNGKCEIYTDVEGVYSADPRIVPGARRYSELPHDLVHEMSVRGAQVMHARSIETAEKAGIEIFVGSTQTGVGTWLKPKTSDPAGLVGIASLKKPGEAEISIVGRKIASNPAISEKACAALEQSKIQVRHLTSNAHSITFSVSDKDASEAVRSLHSSLIK